MEENKVFRSRISILLLGLILGALISSTILVIKNMIIPDLYIIAGVLVFIVFLFSGTRYIISGDKLYIKMWILPSGSVEIRNIISVERSYNPLSSAAASLKRLRIGLSGKAIFPYILISPVREQEFIEKLKVVNPDIKVNITEKKGIWRIWDWDI